MEEVEEEEREKILEFLTKPHFSRPFLKFNDSRKWVSTLQRKNAIRTADSQAIQSKPTSEEANDCLLTLLHQDPSLRKLRTLSEALKEDETHDNQLALAKKIDHFLKSQEPQTVSIERKRPRHDAGLQKYDIPADSCLRAMRYTLMSRPVQSAKDLMKSLYFFTYSIIVELFTEGHLDKIKGQALLIIDHGHMLRVEGKEKSVIMAAESVEKVLDYLGIPNMWDDLQLFLYILVPLKNCDPSCYKEAMGNLDHYNEHLFQYLKVQDMVKNTKALRGPEKTPGQDQVEVHVTVQNSIFQLRYSTCSELLLVVLAEGAGIPRDKIECGPVLPGSSIITFYIPKQYIKSVSKTFYKGAVIWAMLELRVTKIEVLGHFHLDVNWNTAVLPIRDSLLSNGDLFRNTKILPKAFQAIVDLMPPLPGKKGLPLQRYQAQLLSDSFSDVILFTQDKPKWWDDKKLPVDKSELEMEAAELKNEIKSMEDQHNDTIVELHLFKVKYSNEREQVGNLQSQLTKTEKTLLRERNENERIKELMNQDLLEKVTSLESQLKDSEKAKGEVESLVKEYKLLKKENDELTSRIDHYDPSLRKLRALSEALKEDETHDNQQKLAKKIDHFLKSQEPQTVSIERKGPRHDAGLQKYNITADSCLQTMECTLMSRPVPSAEDVMKSLYSFTYSLIVALFTERHLDKIKGQALRIIDRRHMVRVEGKEKSVIMAAESVEKVLDYLGVPNMWDDLLLFVTILLPLKNCDPSCYKEAMGNLDHYKQHLFQYLKVQDIVKNTKALQGPEKTPGQDQVEVHVTVQNSIFQLRYSTCNELLLVVLAEGACIP